MYSALGGWPVAIGTRGFPSGLQFHAEAAVYGIVVSSFLSAFVALPGMIICLLARHYRGFFYCCVSAGSYWAFFFLAFQFAPKAYLVWWID
jgi:hypothetical protein